jgi:PET assembly of cytochrome c oxidase, mitochondrial
MNSNNRYTSISGAATSRPPYGTMMLVLFISSSAIVYTHYSQKRDRRIMRAGVERDKERLRITREKNSSSSSGNQPT